MPVGPAKDGRAPRLAGGARFFLEYNHAMEKVGFGLGLRHEHYEEILAAPGKVEWFEALSENYMVAGGQPLALARHLPARLSDGAARRVAVDRLDRSARSSSTSRTSRR